MWSTQNDTQHAWKKESEKNNQKCITRAYLVTVDRLNEPTNYVASDIMEW